MMWTDLLTGVLLALGGFFVFVGGVGVLRMPDLYTRMHAASVTETLGTLLILAGLMVHSGLNLATVKLLLILVFLLFTAPVASYAVANTALIAGLKPKLDGDDTAPAAQPAGASK
jgi:multicomponent Na+:H+ antiporter subunit G